MTAQLVRQDDGSYDYVQVGIVKKPIAPNLTEFEAYEGAKKGGEELVSAPSLTEQTEKIRREIPGQVEFDPKTGQFITKKAKTTDIAYTPGEITPESTELTSLQKVMSMPSSYTQGDKGLEKAYSLIEQQQKLQAQKQRTEALQGYLQTGTQLYNIASGKDWSWVANIKEKISPITGMRIGPRGTLGTVGTAGMLGYGISGLVGGKPRQQKGAGIGSAVGMAVGGPVGGIVGGVIGHVFGCFSQDTPITMTDGTTKPIIEIDLKDQIAVGGFVFALGKFLINDLYDYKGIKVSGTHMVNEEGIWKEIKDSKYGKSLGNDEHIVYTLGTDKRRILINNILFTDYFEIEEKDKLHEIGDEYFNTWRDHVVVLNNKNHKILNAI